MVGAARSARQLFQECTAHVGFVLHETGSTGFIVHGTYTKGGIVVAKAYLNALLKGRRIGSEGHRRQKTAPLVAVIAGNPPAAVEQTGHGRVQIPRGGIVLGEPRVLGF
jgi:hypothetical protein